MTLYIGRLLSSNCAPHNLLQRLWIVNRICSIVNTLEPNCKYKYTLTFHTKLRTRNDVKLASFMIKVRMWYSKKEVQVEWSCFVSKDVRRGKEDFFTLAKYKTQQKKEKWGATPIWQFLARVRTIALQTQNPFECEWSLRLTFISYILANTFYNFLVPS